MFKTYSLRIDENFFDDYVNHGQAIQKNNKSLARYQLEHLLEDDGSVFAEKIMNEWFSAIDAQVFISHSHKDRRQAIGLAGLLDKEAGISSFIDSCVWGQSTDLQKELIRKSYGDNQKGISIEAQSGCGAAVHTMLTSSLLKMIDKCECIFFLNTPNSISSRGYNQNSGTDSPWIYFEILATRLLSVRRPARFPPGPIGPTEFKSWPPPPKPKIKYDANLTGMIELNEEKLANWLVRSGGFANAEDALEWLYYMTRT